MSQQEIEVILSRHLAEHLAMPIFIVDPQGNMLYYNEPAEEILGMRYQDTGSMPASEWSTAFQPSEQDGTPIRPEELPLMLAMMKRHPAHRRFWIRGLDDAQRQIELTAFPLIGQADRFVGAMAIFWEIPE
ncbi:MAG: PAS domain-containing protein [Anaerolineales bacterium]|nr:MAG: PAS domain-containing protein [Anaerolineales bacterium]